ncbi:MAG: sigma-70 family RNA polymerase sigma factor [Anaerolineales bacterium]|nr:MAG: sigma-70 family RNA polymerase sigma factor [Anaerolineales bacterium]
MTVEHSDAQLIAACLQGEGWAWNVLVDRYKRLVYSIALRAGLGQEDAADVFQTVFTVLLENLSRIYEPQGLAAWLITTAKRTSWNVLRKRQRDSGDREGASVTLSAAEEWLLSEHWEEERWVDQALVGQALERLGGRCKRLLQLLYYDRSEPTYEQISERLRMPLGSIGPTRARCLQKMRTILRAMGMTEK